MKPSERIEEIHRNNIAEKITSNPLETILWDLACRVEAITQYLDEQAYKESK